MSSPSAGADGLATGGVNGRGEHFATAAEESQHIEEFIAIVAKSCAHDFGVAAVLTRGFYGLGERNRLVGSDRRALLRLGQAAGLRHVGGLRRSGHKAGEKNEDQSGEDRHGRKGSGVPVNAM
jgi:hypothetical protein